MSTGFRGNRAGSYQQTTFPANRAVITNSEGRIDFSPVTSDEVENLANSRGNIQEQIDGISSDVEINSFNLNSVAWSNALTLPVSVGEVNSSAVVYEGEIHIIGGSNNVVEHYKLNSSTNAWDFVSTLPISISWGSAIVYNNEIHILKNTNHYKFNSSTNEWESVSTLPFSFSRGGTVIYNDEIHILGGDNSTTSHYKLNSSTNEWESVSTLPFPFYHGWAVVYNDEIHIMGGLGNAEGSDIGTSHYKWNGTTWTNVSTLPIPNSMGCFAVVYNNEIHILGSWGSSYKKKHYKWNGTSWGNDIDLPYDYYWGGLVAYNDDIYVIGGQVGSTRYFKYMKTWSSNSDSTTSTDYPYIYEIQRNLFTDDSKPIWQVEGVGDIPTSTETQEAGKIAYAYFDSTGITLYATEKPNCDLVLRVKGV